MMNRTALVFILSAMLIVTAGCGAKTNNSVQENQGTPTESVDNNTTGGAANEEESPKSWSEMPAMAIDKEKNYNATFKTNKGEFTIELFAKDAPQTVNSFVFLSKEKFYDGVKFHRIIKDFMIQGGDPLGNGTGGPGYTIPDEFNNGHKFEAGILAMANTGQPESGGSQFFICTGTGADFLNTQPNYTIFGKVTKGMDIVTAIANTPVGPGNGEPTDSKPTEDVTIESVSISEK
ncbi:Peptidyl-prolyl cis-trans isomerase (rotamase)-cyclophilin family [Paenibacillus sp. CF384]|nr:peptidylprolyl isomerase [Paenibacillus sp. CF384]SDX77243.1 Peptidyl-prolyl cis-trans isomerase (rotamase)-cyclophilin family [Paenibacillus sp. CF384]